MAIKLPPAIECARRLLEYVEKHEQAPEHLRRFAEVRDPQHLIDAVGEVRIYTVYAALLEKQNATENPAD